MNYFDLMERFMVNTSDYDYDYNRYMKPIASNTQFNSKLPEIKQVIFNEPATIVIWEDGTKTVVKCQKNDVYSKETGFAMCLIKKLFNNSNRYNELFKKYVYED